MTEPSWLAIALGAALERVVPDRFVVSVDSEWVAIGERANVRYWSGADVDGIAFQKHESPGKAIEWATISLLDQVQDFIAETLAQPWPGEREMPLPFATVPDGFLYAGYGSEVDPRVALEPVALPSAPKGH